MTEILVVDDDKQVLILIKTFLEREGYKVVTASGKKRALNLAKKKKFDLGVIDLKLEQPDGMKLMQAIHEITPELPIVILTGFATIETAVEAMQKGACGFLTKPLKFREFLPHIQNCLKTSELTREVERLRSIVEGKYSVDSIIGKSDKMAKVKSQIIQAAEVESVVYIQGESGTGKELIAQSLHFASSRKNGPFVAINCAAIPETLLESELFGYERGAFTGADRNKKGLFLEAHKGTFFLDEISEMPFSMQAKLLRVLEDKKIYPLGGSGRPVNVDSRILAASNKNLEDEVKRRNFREDLFYRIHVIAIEIPPLRERKDDITLLASYFLTKYAARMNKNIKGLSPAATQKLLAYEWPGNVRELENSIESAVVMSLQDIITEDLILPARKINNEGLISFKEARENFEKDYLIQLMELTGGNVTKAAKIADKYRADLYDLLKRYNIVPADFRNK